MVYIRCKDSLHDDGTSGSYYNTYSMQSSRGVKRNRYIAQGFLSFLPIRPKGEVVGCKRFFVESPTDIRPTGIYLKMNNLKKYILKGTDGFGKC